MLHIQTSPFTELHGCTKPISVKNVCALVTNEDLTTGDLPLGSPVLKHLKVQKQTFPKLSIITFIKDDLSDVKSQWRGDK